MTDTKPNLLRPQYGCCRDMFGVPPAVPHCLIFGDGRAQPRRPAIQVHHRQGPHQPFQIWHCLLRRRSLVREHDDLLTAVGPRLPDKLPYVSSPAHKKCGHKTPEPHGDLFTARKHKTTSTLAANETKSLQGFSSTREFPCTRPCSPKH